MTRACSNTEGNWGDKLFGGCARGVSGDCPAGGRRPAGGLAAAGVPAGRRGDPAARRQAHEPERRRFFGYMNLFVASMLLLVLADNYLVLYVGWEGVGLASYLLIGFWQFKPAAAVAAKKAFVANRVGDAGLSVAIMLMFAEFGTVSFTGLFGSVGSGGSGVATA